MAQRLTRTLVAGLVLLLAGCAQYRNDRGVEVNWQPGVLEGLVRGETTRADVLARLGPPSQVIASGDETVLYYLNEHAEGEGLLLVLYNRFEVDTRYDRAIFFFDAGNRLTDYATWLRPAADD
ncbi:MAG TPA: hypothetical protein VJ947_00895 [Pseudohaliea sp.]|nr:hypothetical protein [Pseudohaliea sp.]